MKTESKVDCLCRHCLVTIEFEAGRSGQTIVCPHCHCETLLYTSPDPDASVVQAPTFSVQPSCVEKAPAWGTIKPARRDTTAALVMRICGYIFCVLGLGCALVPATAITLIIIGLILLAIAWEIKACLVCSECGNLVANKEVKMCPTCKAQLDPTITKSL